jgi:hypothetical protein
MMLVKLVQEMDWSMVIMIALTLGLAPFFPVPHIVEKLLMLSRGTLKRPLDWFDLFFHGIPWMILFMKVGLTFVGKN